jgi:hypothetical protein
MSGPSPPLPNTPPWHGAQLKHKGNFTFTFETPGCSWGGGDTIEMELKEIGYEDMDWIYQALDRGQWQDLGNVVTNSQDFIWKISL